MGAIYGPITVINTATNLAAYSTAMFTPTFGPSKSTISASDFSSKVNFSANSQPTIIQSRDIDGDTKPDLIILDVNSYTVSIYLNTTSSGGSVGFGIKVDLWTGGSYPQGLVIEDIDLDGRLDIVAVNQNTPNSNIDVFRNLSSVGNISFAPRMPFPMLATGVSLNDIDLDGKPDLFVINPFTLIVSIYKNVSTVGNIGFLIKLL